MFYKQMGAEVTFADCSHDVFNYLSTEPHGVHTEVAIK